MNLNLMGKPGLKVLMPIDYTLPELSQTLANIPSKFWGLNCKLRSALTMRFDCCSVFLLLTFTNFLFLHISGKTNDVCISPGGRFPPFSNKGKPPRRASKGPKDLTLCRVFRKKTCCDVTQTHPALLSIRRLASTGQASQECLQLWELLECSICDPRVGVQRGPPVVCVSFCDRVYEACSTAYFSLDARTQVLEPCGVGNLVCGRASEWISNGTELCSVAGFSVESSYDPEEISCYGGKASLDYIADSWRTPVSGVPHREESTGVLDDFKQWVAEMPFNERVSWAVGGMVLTAGLLFASKRKSHNRRQKKAAAQYAARKLGTKVNSATRR